MRGAFVGAFVAARFARASAIRCMIITGGSGVFTAGDDITRFSAA